LVEDDEVDVEAVQRALRKHDVSNPLLIASNGIEALDILRAEMMRGPVVILLDINMPRMNGHEFLASIRSDPELRASIVFMLTTSESEADKAEAYERQVAGYLIKGRLGSGLGDLVGFLDAYGKMNEFPNRIAEVG